MLSLTLRLKLGACPRLDFLARSLSEERLNRWAIAQLYSVLAVCYSLLNRRDNRPSNLQVRLLRFLRARSQNLPMHPWVTLWRG
ncbi:MAG: hypothetical protein M3O33_06765 [Cyanobacteriota bacterium]|nr:hypothetical protein [Cyanobacteriota bacterium]